ncbi:hypothetical protein V6N11_068089 [Hibiscus sabdariffa]|uniref:DUF4283 domain-containing protein n=1 Tax=Hibiscus sabdariffa TaxID=183260 RepID=A0ABR2STP3_9ROSI
MEADTCAGGMRIRDVLSTKDNSKVQHVEKVVQILGEVGGSSIAKPEWKLIDQSLSFYLPVENNGSVLVQPPPDVLLNGAKQWLNALIRNFLERVRDWVLESGPWHIQQKAIVLRKWSPGMLSEVISMDTAPVWLKLWHMSLELYSQQGLGCIASALGKPFYTDKATTLKHHLEFAKGNTIDIFVELVWSPPHCSHCCIFGHGEENCKKVDFVVKVAESVANEVVEFVDNVPGFVASVEESGNNGTRVVDPLDIIESDSVGNEAAIGVNGIVAPFPSVVGDVRPAKLGMIVDSGTTSDLQGSRHVSSDGPEVSSRNRFGCLSPENEDEGVSVVSPSKVRVATEGFN